MLLSTADFGHVARGVLLFGVYLLMSEVCMSASNMVAEDSSYLMTRKLSDALQNRVKRTEAIAFEKEDTLNEIQQARDGIENGTYLLYLVECTPVLIVLLLLVTVPIGSNQVIK
ncbi:MAG: hypothetical protein HFH92_18040 [Lachnospiraceae bacterium]|uniref:hypothetical protein n=2 Tax=uncultured Acetatifactor sp. TaxID=1671927 RepID=UPI00262AE0CD|nr:hypothetical protein [uncultured Acetatifactor sp.]MCI8790954.1 hypothetical protein [Lachnospiraceae bacterium]